MSIALMLSCGALLTYLTLLHLMVKNIHHFLHFGIIIYVLHLRMRAHGLTTSNISKIKLRDCCVKASMHLMA